MQKELYVMLIEDDAATGEMYRMGLEMAGFRVRLLSNAVDLNAMVAADTPNALILDWDLPLVRGDVALEHLRATDVGRNLPVFMLSNFPGIGDGAIDRAFAAGVTAWFLKVNMPPAELAMRVAYALGISPVGSSTT